MIATNAYYHSDVSYLSQESMYICFYYFEVLSRIASTAGTDVAESTNER